MSFPSINSTSAKLLAAGVAIGAVGTFALHQVFSYFYSDRSENCQCPFRNYCPVPSRRRRNPNLIATIVQRGEEDSPVGEPDQPLQ